MLKGCGRDLAIGYIEGLPRELPPRFQNTPLLGNGFVMCVPPSRFLNPSAFFPCPYLTPPVCRRQSWPSRTLSTMQEHPRQSGYRPPKQILVL